MEGTLRYAGKEILSIGKKSKIKIKPVEKRKDEKFF
jgi:hypothetical protein